MMKWLAACAATAMLSVISVSTAQAHYIWLERDGVTVKAFFGEWEGNLREVSGGTLDRITSLKAFETNKAKLLTVTKETNHFAIKGSAKGDVRALEERAPVEDKVIGGKTKTIFQAKEGRSDTKPVHDLELVPVSPNANIFVLMLRGSPLAKAEMHVYGPPKWGKEFTTDEQGKVTIPLHWAGRYVIEVIYLEKAPGGEGEGAYDRVRHVATSSFKTSRGITWKVVSAK